MLSSIYSFRVKLLEDKKTFRDLEISGDSSLEKLASAICDAFDFDFDHAFGFYSNCSARDFYDSEHRYELFVDEGLETEPGTKGVQGTKISSVFKQTGQKYLYLFDYGDDWMFEVEFTAMSKAEASVKYPRVVKKAGEAPVQYPDYDADDEYAEERA